MNAAIDLRGILPSIHVPTLVLYRADDARVNPEAGRYSPAHIPGARLRSSPGRDHPLRTGDVDAAVDAIEEFLTGMPPHSEPRRVLAALLALNMVGAGRGGARVADRFWPETLRALRRNRRGWSRREGSQVLRRRRRELAAALRRPGPRRACASRCAAPPEPCGCRWPRACMSAKSNPRARGR